MSKTIASSVGFEVNTSTGTKVVRKKKAEFVHKGKRITMKRIAAIFIIALSFGLITEATAQKKAPNFSLKTGDGKIYELVQSKGKVVIVNFWATWCSPCRKEIPDFIEVYKMYKDQGLEIVGVSLDKGGWEKVNPFVKQNNINYPVVLDNGTVAATFGKIQFIPTTFIIDPSGNIVDEHTGVMTKAMLEAKIKPLLKKGV
ncbi:MAG: TlpA disulfide reductase family protein [Ignavibacteria bacterium]|nr:TlpA disulfide reductase family protein [Ignavibacteria bacterium]